jgi:hypothetical protein
MWEGISDARKMANKHNKRNGYELLSNTQNKNNHKKTIQAANLKWDFTIEKQILFITNLKIILVEYHGYEENI